MGHGWPLRPFHVAKNPSPEHCSSSFILFWAPYMLGLVVMVVAPPSLLFSRSGFSAVLSLLLFLYLFFSFFLFSSFLPSVFFFVLIGIAMEGGTTMDYDDSDVLLWAAWTRSLIVSNSFPSISAVAEAVANIAASVANIRGMNTVSDLIFLSYLFLLGFPQIRLLEFRCVHQWIKDVEHFQGYLFILKDCAGRCLDFLFLFLESSGWCLVTFPTSGLFGCLC